MRHWRYLFNEQVRQPGHAPSDYFADFSANIARARRIRVRSEATNDEFGQSQVDLPPSAEPRRSGGRDRRHGPRLAGCGGREKGASNGLRAQRATTLMVANGACR